MYNYLSVAKLDHVVQQFTDIKEHYDKMRYNNNNNNIAFFPKQVG